MVRIGTLVLIVALTRQSSSFHQTSTTHFSRHPSQPYHVRPCTGGRLALFTNDDVPMSSRKEILVAMTGIFFSSLVNPLVSTASDDMSTITTKVAACPSTSSNCISTASVRQLQLYMPPWIYPDEMLPQEVLARLKGAISTDNMMTIAEQTDTAVLCKATRNFAVDELVFVVNAEDHVVTFSSRQVEGPDSSDFGAMRKRLEDLRRRAAVFQVMGGEESADNAPAEGALGQLKAFYGLQSGAGFEDVLLNRDE
jgi:uncharacterized protein (DUF1499 family)